MADDGFKDYIIKFLLAGLFIVCLFSFGVSFTVDQGKSSDIINDNNLNIGDLERQINETSEDAEAWGEAFRSDNVFVQLGAVIMFSIWGVMKLMWSSIITLFTLILDSASTVLGVPPIVLGVILAILIISLIFAGWRVVKRGD